MAFAILGSPKPAFFDSSGSPLAAGTLEVRNPADDTFKATYPTYDDAEAQTNANGGTITIDDRGEVELWGRDGEAYKLTLLDALGGTVWTIDDITMPDEVTAANIYPTSNDLAQDLNSLVQTAGELAAAVTPTDYSYPPGDIRRYGAVGDGVTDDSAAFSAALTMGDLRVYIPYGTYYLDGSQILVESGTHIVCDPSATIQKNADGVDGGWIRFRDVSNCSVQGGTWEYVTKPTTDEGRHIFDLRGCSDVVIRDTRANKAGGDGYFVGDGVTNDYSQRVLLENVHADNCRRQGLSIVSGIDIRVNDPVLENITGTAPQAGIDIEPDVSTDELKGIRIKNPITRNCSGPGIKAVINDLPTDYELDIVIDGHFDDGSESGFNPQYGTEMLGRITYNDAQLANNGLNGIFVRGWQSNSSLIDINRPTIINPNADSDASNPYQGNGIAVYAHSSGDTQTDIGNVIIREPRIIDNRGTTQMKDGIFARNLVAAGVIRDVSIIDPLEIVGYGATDDALSLVSVINYLVTDRYRILQRDHTADANVSISDHYSIETNEGAAGTVTLTLDDDIEPGPSLFTFEVRAAFELRVDPEALSSILPGGGAGVRISSSTIGDKLVLRRDSSTSWYIVEKQGNWSFSTGPQSVASDGTTGGAASAGAGNQYVELEIGGTTYRVLHDGTI